MLEFAVLVSTTVITSSGQGKKLSIVKPELGLGLIVTVSEYILSQLLLFIT